jgi:ATP-dependent Clp protease ATP-binding subunit ClpC
VGRVVDFKNTILIMTTNLGGVDITGRKPLGFGLHDDDATYEGMKLKLKEAMKNNFRPEFLNRVDDVIVFRGLSRDNIRTIIDIELMKVSKRLLDKGLKLVLTDEARDLLIAEGYSPEYGARPLRRAIEHLLEDPLSEDLLRGTFKGKDTILVKVREDGEKKKLSFESVESNELVGAGT